MNRFFITVEKKNLSAKEQMSLMWELMKTDQRNDNLLDSKTPSLAGIKFIRDCVQKYSTYIDPTNWEDKETVEAFLDTLKTDRHLSDQEFDYAQKLFVEVEDILINQITKIANNVVKIKHQLENGLIPPEKVAENLKLYKEKSLFIVDFYKEIYEAKVLFIN